MPGLLIRWQRPGPALAVLAAALWLASLLAPALGVRGGPTLTGLDVLRQGLGAWRYGVLAWFANPALLVAVIALLRRSPRLALGSGAAALVLAVSSFWSADIAALFGRRVPELSFASGFYLWMAAHLAAVIGGICERAGRSASG